MDVRAINLRLGDAVVYKGIVDTIKSLEVVGSLVEIRFTNDSPDDWRSCRWNEPVQVLDYERKLPATPARPKPTPKRVSRGNASHPLYADHGTYTRDEIAHREAADSEVGVGYWQHALPGDAPGGLGWNGYE